MTVKDSVNEYEVIDIDLNEENGDSYVIFKVGDAYRVRVLYDGAPDSEFVTFPNLVTAKRVAREMIGMSVEGK